MASLRLLSVTPLDIQNNDLVFLDPETAKQIDCKIPLRVKQNQGKVKVNKKASLVRLSLINPSSELEFDVLFGVNENVQIMRKK